MRKLVALALFLAAAPAFAQANVGGIAAKAFPVQATAAQVAAITPTGRNGARIVYDAASTASCTVAYTPPADPVSVLCIDDGTSWVPVGDGGGGGGASQCSDLTGSTSAGCAIVEATDAAAQRTALGLGTAATTASTIYPLLAGRSGGQTLYGGTSTADTFSLFANTADTTGPYFKLFGSTSGGGGHAVIVSGDTNSEISINNNGASMTGSTPGPSSAYSTVRTDADGRFLAEWGAYPTDGLLVGDKTTGDLTLTGGNYVGSFVGPLTGAVTGNASTATAFAANPTDCGAGQFGTTIAANGDLTCAAVTPSNVGLGNVTNDAQTKAAIMPNTAPSAGQVPAGNAGGTAYAPQTIGGDATLASTGALTVAKVNGVAYGTSPSTDAVPVVTAANTVTYKVIGDCDDTGGNHVNYDTTTHTFSCGTTSAGSGIGGSTGATDNRVIRADGTGGATVQSSAVTIDDAGAVSGVTQLDVDNVRVDGNTISTTDSNGDLTLAPNGTGRVVGPTGSASKPAFTFSGNTTTGFYAAGGPKVLLSIGATDRFSYNVGELGLVSIGSVTWSSAATTPGLSQDTGIARSAAGVVKFTDGSTGAGSYSIVTSTGASWTSGSATELLTLSTSGTTTDTTANLLPANSVIKSCVARVTTTITTATDWSVGDATTAARFASANATMTAGSTSIGLNHMKGGVATDAAGPTQTAAAKVRITTTGTPGAGVVRITCFYETFVAPTS